MSHVSVSTQPRQDSSPPQKPAFKKAVRVRATKKNGSRYLDRSRLYLGLELVGGGLDRHARAVEAEREQCVLSLEALVLHGELALRMRRRG